MWRGTDLAGVKLTWASKLSGFANMPEAIKAALDALDDRPLPPTLPEFLHLCRDAARRAGPAAKALEHKLTPEEIERNRQHARKLIDDLARRKAA
jgi:hypothetical protein